MIPLGKYMVANLLPRPTHQKTSLWDIRSSKGNSLLGVVRWYGAWRQYAFMPSANIVLNPDCMDELSAFIRFHMKAENRR